MTEAEHIPAGQRGPAETDKRDAIIAAAKEHFSHYGFSKTTVSDLAKEIGFSKAYIYKFFESKQAIGEAICSDCLACIIAEVEIQVGTASTYTEKFRKLFGTISEQGRALFFDDRKLYDIAAASSLERWGSSVRYQAKIASLLRDILAKGRENGEFERKTPLDEVCRSILLVMQPFLNPMMLQHNLDDLTEAQKEVANLVLRSLAP